MRVPKRKSEEGVYVPADPHITQEKFDELVRKLDRLKKSVPALAQEVAFHAKNGDFSENAPYQIAKGKLRGVNARILELGQQINKAVIIEEAGDSDEVKLGSRVTVLRSEYRASDGKPSHSEQKIYQILGSAETNPLQGIISHNSPLGAALMGHKAGEAVRLELNKKFVEYQIVKIS